MTPKNTDEIIAEFEKHATMNYRDYVSDGMDFFSRKAWLRNVLAEHLLWSAEEAKKETRSGNCIGGCSQCGGDNEDYETGFSSGVASAVEKLNSLAHQIAK